jgi:syntaxin-binding protein 1
MQTGTLASTGDTMGAMAKQAGLTSADPQAQKLTTLRTTKATWAKKTPALVAKQQYEQDPMRKLQKGTDDIDYRKNGGRIIVFVVGGLTFGELRSVYEVMKAEKREIIVGTTNLASPVQFIDTIGDLKQPLDPVVAAKTIVPVAQVGMYVTPPTGQFESMSISPNQARAISEKQPSPASVPLASNPPRTSSVASGEKSGEKKKTSFLNKLKKLGA